MESSPMMTSTIDDNS